MVLRVGREDHLRRIVAQLISVNATGHSVAGEVHVRVSTLDRDERGTLGLALVCANGLFDGHGAQVDDGERSVTLGVHATDIRQAVAHCRRRGGDGCESNALPLILYLELAAAAANLVERSVIAGDREIRAVAVLANLNGNDTGANGGTHAYARELFAVGAIDEGNLAGLVTDDDVATGGCGTRPVVALVLIGLGLLFVGRPVDLAGSKIDAHERTF